MAYNQRYKVLAERVEGRPIQEVQLAVAMEMYLGTIIAPLRRNIKNNLFWNSKHAPKNLGEAMKKSEELYVKHLYSSATEQEEDYSNKKQQEVVINEVNYGERRDQKRSRYEEKREKSFNRSGYRRNENWSEQAKTNPGKNSEKSFFPQANNSDRHVTWTDAANVAEKGEKSNNQRNERSTSANASILKGSYTQIIVNPTQLSEHEFTNWMEKLMEARKNRQERKERPYHSYRKPYNSEQSSRQPQLRNRLRPSTRNGCTKHNDSVQLQL